MLKRPTPIPEEGNMPSLASRDQPSFHSCMIKGNQRKLLLKIFLLTEADQFLEEQRDT